MKIGDNVKIRVGSRFYKKGDHSNPIDLTGIVLDMPTEIGAMDLLVEWPNGVTNSYFEKDLVVVAEKTYEIY